MATENRALTGKHQADLTVEGDQNEEAAKEDDDPHDGCAEGCENLSP
jgi:hypothetical protein